MKTQSSRCGFIDVPGGTFERLLLVLAALGMVALWGWVAWGLWLLVTHLRFVA